jgi:predicted nucleic acid-binding Zn ribbon protein
MANFCTNCGTKLGKDDNFCFNCGVKLRKDDNFCINCGARLGKDDNFCTNCGTKIDKSAMKQKGSLLKSVNDCVEKKKAEKELKDVNGRSSYNKHFSGTIYNGSDANTGKVIKHQVKKERVRKIEENKSHGGNCGYGCKHFREEYLGIDGGLDFDFTGEEIVDHYCDLGHSISYGSFCKYYES